MVRAAHPGGDGGIVRHGQAAGGVAVEGGRGARRVRVRHEASRGALVAGDGLSESAGDELHAVAAHRHRVVYAAHGVHCKDVQRPVVAVCRVELLVPLPRNVSVCEAWEVREGRRGELWCLRCARGLCGEAHGGQHGRQPRKVLRLNAVIAEVKCGGQLRVGEKAAARAHKRGELRGVAVQRGNVPRARRNGGIVCNIGAAIQPIRAPRVRNVNHHRVHVAPLEGREKIVNAPGRVFNIGVIKSHVRVGVHNRLQGRRWH